MRALKVPRFFSRNNIYSRIASVKRRAFYASLENYLCFLFSIPCSGFAWVPWKNSLKTYACPIAESATLFGLSPDRKHPLHREKKKTFYPLSPTNVAGEKRLPCFHTRKQQVNSLEFLKSDARRYRTSPNWGLSFDIRIESIRQSIFEF